MGPASSYPQAASVPSAMSAAPTMHQSAPAPQYTQQQSNGNNNNSQTPPTSQQQSTQPSNQNSVSGMPPPPSNATSGSGNAPMNAAVMAYPPSAATPQSPQYPNAPGPGPGVYPAAPYVVLQPNYMANPQLYSSQGGLAPGAVHIQSAAAVHGYPGPAHAAHFVSPEYAQAHYAQQQATIAAAQHGKRKCLFLGICGVLFQARFLFFTKLSS